MLFKLNAAAIIWCLNHDSVQRSGQKGGTHIFGSGTDPIEASLSTTGRLTRQNLKKKQKNPIITYIKILEANVNSIFPGGTIQVFCLGRRLVRATAGHQINTANFSTATGKFLLEHGSAVFHWGQQQKGANMSANTGSLYEGVAFQHRWALILPEWRQKELRFTQFAAHLDGFSMFWFST